MTTSVPQLLISVRNASEASLALRAGARIVDVKEPTHGSLGRAAWSAIAEIAALFAATPDLVQPVPLLSVALGEVNEWLADARLAADAVDAMFRTRPRYLKLGCSNLWQESASGEGWFGSWMKVRESIPGDHTWVAVAYVDAGRANAPPIEEVCTAAIRSRCGVLLLDTFIKDQSSLLDWVTIDQLRSLRGTTARHGLQLALAGRISEQDLNSLVPAEADILAVRGAVCESGSRTNAICENRIRSFQSAIQLACLAGDGLPVAPQ